MWKKLYESATLLPLGSEPVLLGLLDINPSLFWLALCVATLGNTLGGGVSWWLGRTSKEWMQKRIGKKQYSRASIWLQRIGPKACLLAWLPVIGDPLCAVAGWLKMPLWSCLIYMAIGKFLRYWLLATAFSGLLKLG